VISPQDLLDYSHFSELLSNLNSPTSSFVFQQILMPRYFLKAIRLY